MFHLKKEIIADQEITTMIHPNGISSFSTIPTLGAALFKLRLGDRKLNKDILKKWDNPASFVEDYKQRFPGAQLFPFPNRLDNGAYQIKEKKYAFPHNDFGRPNALHGHLYNQKFHQKEWDPVTGQLTLEYQNKGQDSAYPFCYKITNKFLLSERGLKISTDITNNSTQLIPYGYGWHPYFKTSMDIDNYTLEIPSRELLELNENLIPTMRTTPFDAFIKPAKISNHLLDNCFIKDKNGQLVRLIDPDNKSCISLDISQFGYLQVYIPPERDCIALEPQSSAPDAFNNNLGLEILEPNETKNYSFTISFSAYPQM